MALLRVLAQAVLSELRRTVHRIHHQSIKKHHEHSTDLNVYQLEYFREELMASQQYKLYDHLLLYHGSMRHDSEHSVTVRILELFSDFETHKDTDISLYEQAMGVLPEFFGDKRLQDTVQQHPPASCVPGSPECGRHPAGSYWPAFGAGSRRTDACLGWSYLLQPSHICNISNFKSKTFIATQ